MFIEHLLCAGSALVFNMNYYTHALGLKGFERQKKDRNSLPPFLVPGFPFATEDLERWRWGRGGRC